MKKLFLLLPFLFSCQQDSYISPIPNTPAVVKPDLTPEILSTWNQLTQPEICTIRIHNDGGATTDTTVFYITKMVPVATVIVPTQGVITQEQNTRWKIKVPSTIGANSYKDVTVIVQPLATGSATLNAMIISGTGGGEEPNNNNIGIFKFTAL